MYNIYQNIFSDYVNFTGLDPILANYCEATV